MKCPVLADTCHGRELTVSAETGGAFRVRYSLASQPPAADGTMLAPCRPRSVASIKKTVLSTAAGSVHFSSSGRSLSVFTPAGSRLFTLYLEQDHILLKSEKKGDCYGGGDAGQERFPGNRVRNKPFSLTKKVRIKSLLGNGVSVVPFMWQSSGWALLLLAEDAAAEIRPMDKSGKMFRLQNTRALTDLVVMPAATLAEAVTWLADISGHAPVPPRWVLGFMHSRWGYKSFEEIQETWRAFRSRKHPVDAFIYDFEWYTPKPDYKLPAGGRRDFDDFGWNCRIFYDPVDQLAESRALNIRTVVIRKPRLGNSNQLKKAQERGWRIAGRKTEIEEPADARTLDFRNPELRKWYWERNRPLMEQGVDAWWNDEGEQFPSLYYWWNRAQQDGQQRDFPCTRFWSINRAYSIGLARTGASVWTGDTRSGWNDLRKECLKVLNAGLCGMPWITCDLGGFSGDPTPELMVRYMQMGVFFPIMRTHSTTGRTPRTPWNFGEEAEDAIRRALQWRYRLLAYTNSLAHETSRTGIPLARPMLLEFPRKMFNNVWEQWMYGPAILAAPVLDEGGRRIVHLPRGCSWYDLETNESVRGGRKLKINCKLNRIPAWQRSGSIIPISPVIQHSGELELQTLELRVATGNDVCFTMVEDDGFTPACQKGAKLKTMWTWNERLRKLTSRVAGSFDGLPASRSYSIRVLGCAKVTSIFLNGKELQQGRNHMRGWSLAGEGNILIATGNLLATAPITIRLQ
jgi:alpha-glucosidase